MLVVRDLEQRAVASVVEQTKHSEALRDSEERLRAILQTAVEGIITIDARGVIESFNPAAEKIFGYGADEVIGKNVKSLMPEPYRREHDGYLANYHRSGDAKIIGIGREVAGCRKDGTVFPMDLSVNEVRLADRVIFAGFVRDISEQRRRKRRCCTTPPWWNPPTTRSLGRHSKVVSPVGTGGRRRFLVIRVKRRSASISRSSFRRNGSRRRKDSGQNPAGGIGGAL